VRLLSSLCVCAAFACAGPVEFGQAELDAAMAARHLRWKNVVELSVDPAETFRIEPYRLGGAHITGGDLRGLMYGLLEAAEQVRANGKLAKTHGAPAASLRGLRLVVDSGLEHAPEEYWRGYFQLLARNRFNRVHVIVPDLDPPYKLGRFLSQVAADYAIDFTLGIEREINARDLSKLLAACPMIRSVAASAAAREPVLAALQGAGRRVTLDEDFVPSSNNRNVAVLRPSANWPPSFEIAPPPGSPQAADHEIWYWIWGRFGYDPSINPPKGSDQGAFQAAREIALLVNAARQIEAGGSEFVTPAEDGSPRMTPAEIASLLNQAEVRLQAAPAPDFQAFSQMARAEAQKLSPGGELPVSNSPAKTHFARSAPNVAALGKDLTIALEIPAPKDLKEVTLHYRPLRSASPSKKVAMEPGARMQFTIPAADLSPGEELMYYFEISARDGRQWFDPDPLTGLPAPTVKVDVAPPVQ